jgi:putative phosphoesterase
VRVAALYDVHGNLPALRAVLEQVASEEIDEIVFGGDVAAGPFPRETIELARAVPNTRFVQGNADRYVAEIAEGAREPQGIVDEWIPAQLDTEQLEFLRSHEPTVSLDGVLYCHATPQADEPTFTRITPKERVRKLLGDVDERTIVCGHTHMQFDRTVYGIRVVNAGSVGFAFGTPNACWALVVDGEPQLRETPYDRDLLRSSAYRQVDKFLDPPPAEEMLEFYESQAAAG